MAALLKITRILKRSLKSIIEFYFFSKNNWFFSEYIMMKVQGLKKIKIEKKNIIKDARNLFRLKKLKKETKQMIQ